MPVGEKVRAGPLTILLNHQDCEGNTALHMAVAMGHEKSAVALVQVGASVHVLNNETETVLDLAERKEEQRGGESGKDPADVREGRRSMVVALLRSMTMRPVWVPDELVPRCLCCKARFTVSLRRHHCRHCGRVVCGRCSPQKVKIEKFEFDKPQRVCMTCFDVLTFRRLE
jgi:hypothetical protein